VAQVIPLPEKPKQRIAPLHPGAIEMSDDFDAPLPDEFWLGKE
jgi:antitoxin (DNA-binding transcriptional repressor) of toxin-antitoxin stability system